MKNVLYFLILIFLMTIIPVSAIDTPADPDGPVIIITDSNSEEINDNNNEEKNNIEYQNQAGFFNKGVIKNLDGTYLTLDWDSKKNSNQEILIDFVKSIRIKGYTPVKKGKNNLSIVYYFPYVFDIVLKDGQIIKGAKGRISELESFTIYNSIGRQKCYTYFIRYWLEDKQMFNDNQSGNLNETPKVPESVIIFMEFIKT